MDQLRPDGRAGSAPGRSPGKRRPMPLPRESSSSSLERGPLSDQSPIPVQHPKEDDFEKLKQEIRSRDHGAFSQAELKARDFVCLRTLGSGSGGTVQLVKHLPSNFVMARKMIHLEIKPEIQQQIIRELRVLDSCKSPDIVSYHGSFLNDGEINILMEYMDGGSLDLVLQRIGRVEENVIRHICFRILRGLTYLATTLKVMHRDIKPSNVLVNSSGDIKLCDFGVSAELTNSIAFTFVGTRFYMAPERLLGKEYAVASDVWSMGLSLIELATGRFPIPPDEANTLVEIRNPNSPPLPPQKSNMSVFDLLGHIVDGEPPKLPESFSREFRDFVSKCLVKDPAHRASLAELMVHPWIKGVDANPVDLSAWVMKTFPERELASVLATRKDSATSPTSAAASASASAAAAATATVSAASATSTTSSSTITTKMSEVSVVIADL
eukprot:m.112987 g.112987  ORF g.112987 m.112987 type:complete len:439 (-) comp15989_c0_seq1:502-1818(-)